MRPKTPACGPIKRRVLRGEASPRPAAAKIALLHARGRYRIGGGQIRRLLAEPSESERLDDAAFEAFGLSSSDPGVVRDVMRGFAKGGSAAQAAWYAERLLRLAPGDPEATALVQRAKKMAAKPTRLVDLWPSSGE